MIQEGQILPFATSPLPEGPWLVFAPHADDETFGMGGAIALAAEQGTEVHLVVVTDGSAGGDAQDAGELVAAREREARAAADRLGIRSVGFWHQPDRRLLNSVRLQERVAQQVRDRKPASVFFPSPMEPHPDHRTTALLVWQGVERSGREVGRFSYEISVQGQVNRLLDITPALEAKRAAMACYASQLEQNDYGELVLALNRTRTYTLPEEVRYAEGFFAYSTGGGGELAVQLVERLRLFWDVTQAEAHPPLVSVIVRTKDRPTALRRALDSLAEQSYNELEVVVVNDGTVDVDPVCRDFAGAFCRLHIIGPAGGGGRIRAANKGLEAASGELVMFLDDDDWFLPQHVEKLVTALAGDRDAGLAYTGVECVSHGDDGRLEKTHTFNQPFESVFLLLRNFIPIHAALFRRELIEAGIRFDESLLLYEDWDFWVQLAQKTRFLHVDGISACYLVGGASGFGVEADTGLQSRAQAAFFEKWRRLWSPEQLRELVDFARQVPELRQRAHDEGKERRRIDTLVKEQEKRLERMGREHGAERRRMQNEASEQQQRLEHATRETAELAQRLQAMSVSISWRITEPLRLVLMRIQGVRRRSGNVLRRNRRRLENVRWLLQTQGVRGLLAHLRRRVGAGPQPLPQQARERQPLPLIRIAPKEFSGAARALAIPACDDPLVSVVVPVYGHLEYTLACLTSISRNPPECGYELILVDDASPDASEQVLRDVPNIRYLRNGENLGFVRSCNRGAEAARGRYLMFLNNDTQVRPGWLDALVETLERHADAGIAGSKLVYPSGHLQEAGTNLRGDGSVELVGLNGDPDDPRYNFARPVDHCSGAALLIRTGLFRELGGFDRIYAPAYFEDADLSLRVRAKGYKVYYQPGSEILHHLSVTTEKMPRGKMAQIERNKTLFLERWQTRLAAADKVRLIAFYLPQYHPIPENDDWWGKGFTEWTNVTKARPNFDGHYQPHHPSDLGYYDLRVTDVREEQARLAREYGIHGFCYYYYWFGGKRLLDRPLNEVLATGKPDFPFCVCWANENWTRRWDGRDSEVLIAQEYGEESARSFIQDLLPAFRDRRYIRIDGRPLLLVYRADLIPDLGSTLRIWRELCRESGVGEPYLAAVESFSGMDNADAAGFDATVEFPPHGKGVVADPPPRLTNPDFVGNLYDYRKTADNFMHRSAGPKVVFRAAMPSWDNTARRQDTADIFVDADPDYYAHWLGHIVRETRDLRTGDERIVFVNAWNEWAEGNHLEPDRKHGRAYLEATREALGDMGCYAPPEAERPE